MTMPATQTQGVTRQAFLRGGLAALGAALLPRSAAAQTVAEVTPASIPLSVVPPAPRGDALPYTLKIDSSLKAKSDQTGLYFRQLSIDVVGRDKGGEAFTVRLSVGRGGIKPYIGRVTFYGNREEEPGVKGIVPYLYYTHQEFAPGVPNKSAGPSHLLVSRFNDQELEGFRQSAAEILKKATALLDTKCPANSPPATPREESIAAEPAVHEIARDVAAFFHTFNSRVKPRTASAG